MADFVGVISLVVIGVFIGFSMGLVDVSNYKKEAFDRGFMVQCVGNTGYYWECE